jgi:aryl-alcohol dehydrogenase-like predicted oxidoreductase
MMQYSLLDRRPEETCLELLHQHQVGVLVRGSLAKGLLVNKPAETYLNYSGEVVRKAAQAVQSLITQEREAASVAIRFALHPPAVSSAVVGIRTAGQLAAALKAGQTPPLSPEEINRLAGVIPINRYEEHR